MNLYIVLEIARRAEALLPTPFGVLLDYWSLKTNKTKINTGNAATQTEKLARDRNMWKFVGNNVAKVCLNSFCMSSKLQGNISKSIDDISAEPVEDNIWLPVHSWPQSTTTCAGCCDLLDRSMQLLFEWYDTYNSVKFTQSDFISSLCLICNEIIWTLAINVEQTILLWLGYRLMVLNG